MICYCLSLLTFQCRLFAYKSHVIQLLQAVLLQNVRSALFSRAKSRFDGCIAMSVHVKGNVNSIFCHRVFCKNPFSVAYNGQKKVRAVGPDVTPVSVASL